MVRFLVSINLYLCNQCQKLCSSWMYCSVLAGWMCSGKGSADDFAKPPVIETGISIVQFTLRITGNHRVAPTENNAGLP